MSSIAPNSLAGESGQYDVDGVLDQLFQLSRAIRRSGITPRLARAAQFTQEDEEARKIAETFRHGVNDYLDKTLTLDPFLRERFLDTICLRQQYFAYLSAQRASRDSTSQSDLFQRHRQNSPQGSYIATSHVGPGQSKTSRNIRKGRMKATTVGSNVLPVPSELNWVGIEDLDADLPRRPKKLRGKDAECPYCYTVCPKAELTDPGWA